VSNEEFELVGGVGLAHEMVEFAFRERFVGRENEMAVIKRGGGVFDPKVSIGNLAIPPTLDGRAGVVPVEDISQLEKTRGGFFVALLFLWARLRWMESTTPGQALAP
jgi:hypothetical protein